MPRAREKGSGRSGKGWGGGKTRSQLGDKCNVKMYITCKM